jgi:hypothetical protein
MTGDVIAGVERPLADGFGIIIVKCQLATRYVMCHCPVTSIIFSRHDYREKPQV